MTQRHPTARRTIIAAAGAIALTAVALLAAHAVAAATLTVTADTGGSAEGESTIYCELATVDVHRNCDTQGRRAEIAPVTTGEDATVNLTVTWTPVSSDADTLRITIVGDSACMHQEGKNTSCFVQAAQGPSPLSVELNGSGASDTKVEAFIQAAHVCDYSDGFPNWVVRADCDVPPVRLVQDQDFSYQWSTT